MRSGEKDAKECVFGHCYGLMKCQDKTVSTLEYTCHLLACAHAVKPINFGFVQMLRLLSFHANSQRYTPSPPV